MSEPGPPAGGWTPGAPVGPGHCWIATQLADDKLLFNPGGPNRRLAAGTFWVRMAEFYFLDIVDGTRKLTYRAEDSTWECKRTFEFVHHHIPVTLPRPPGELEAEAARLRGPAGDGPPEPSGLTWEAYNR